MKPRPSDMWHLFTERTGWFARRGGYGDEGIAPLDGDVERSGDAATRRSGKAGGGRRVEVQKQPLVHSDSLAATTAKVVASESHGGAVDDASNVREGNAVRGSRVDVLESVPLDD